MWVWEQPSFRLYEDGTVIFRIYTGGDEIPPYSVAKLTEEQRDEFIQFALRDGGLASGDRKYPTNVDGGGTVFLKLDSPLAKVNVSYGDLADPATGEEAADRAKFEKLAATLYSFDEWLAERDIAHMAYVPQAYMGGFIRLPADEAAEPALPGLAPSDFRPGPTIPLVVISHDLAHTIARAPEAGALIERRFVDPMGGSFGVLLRPMLPGDAIG